MWCVETTPLAPGSSRQRLDRRVGCGVSRQRL